MGGYGATRIGMKHADVFGSAVHHEPVLPVGARRRSARTPNSRRRSRARRRPSRFGEAAVLRARQLATAAAWSPNPKNPPLYLDLPIEDGEPQPEVLAKWAANAPLAFIDQYIGNLRRYRGIAIDVGDQDGLRIDTAKLHDVLDRMELPTASRIYKGTHTSAVAVRFQNHVMPFFSKQLVSDEERVRPGIASVFACLASGPALADSFDARITVHADRPAR